jgi:short-subunit dehydrogenase
MTAGASGAPLALVTGASTGIGRALTAQLVLERGYDVLAVADEDAVHAVAERLSRVGAQVVALVADLATDDGVDQLLATVDRLGRPVELAALNAGTASYGRFHETPAEGDLRVVALNVTCPVRLAKALLPAMVARGHGRVLVTSSIASAAPGPLYATYAASKAFLHSFAEALRVDLDGTGVTVTSLQPGPTDTAIFARTGMAGARMDRGPKDDADRVARAALRATFAGDDKVVTGVRHKVATAGARLLPDRTLARVHDALLRKR